MPGRFEPTILSTGSLMELLEQLNKEVNLLDDEYYSRRDYLDNLVGRDAPEGAIHIARQAFRNCKTAETKAKNKRSLIMTELRTRALAEFRILREQIEDKTKLKQMIDWEIAKREAAGEE
jgi:hypothetical protein